MSPSWGSCTTRRWSCRSRPVAVSRPSPPPMPKARRPRPLPAAPSARRKTMCNRHYARGASPNYVLAGQFRRAGNVTSTSIYYRVYNESTDTAGPTVTDVSLVSTSGEGRSEQQYVTERVDQTVTIYVLLLHRLGVYGWGTQRHDAMVRRIRVSDTQARLPTCISCGAMSCRVFLVLLSSANCLSQDRRRTSMSTSSMSRLLRSHMAGARRAKA